MPGTPLPRTLERIAALADPVRRALYLFVAARPRPVSRDQAARAAGIARPLAAFHLDRLVAEGLLEASYRRLTGRRGPGAGRPAKLYRRSDVQVDLSLPPREYELAARLFAGALNAAPQGAHTRVRRAARDLGKQLGREVAPRSRKAGGRGGLRQVEAALRAFGYEPFPAAPDTIRLHNCPFDALAREYRPLMCGANQAFVAGVVSGVAATGCRAALDPQPGLCCVAVQARKG